MSATIIDIATGKEITVEECRSRNDFRSNPVLEVFSPDGRVVLSIEKIIDEEDRSDSESIAA